MGTPKWKREACKEINSWLKELACAGYDAHAHPKSNLTYGAVWGSKKELGYTYPDGLMIKRHQWKWCAASTNSGYVLFCEEDLGAFRKRVEQWLREHT